MKVAYLRKANPDAVKRITSYPIQKHGNLFFEGLFISALIADPLRMNLIEAV